MRKFKRAYILNISFALYLAFSLIFRLSLHISYRQVQIVDLLTFDYQLIIIPVFHFIGFFPPLPPSNRSQSNANDQMLLIGMSKGFSSVQFSALCDLGLNTILILILTSIIIQSK